MATIKKSNASGFYVKFDQPELRPFDGIRVTITKYNKKLYFNFSFPNVTFRGHESRVFNDIIDALIGAINYAAKTTGQNKPGFAGRGHKATIDTDAHIRFPVFVNLSTPYVEFVREAPDGKPKTYIEGMYFNNDLPSAVALLIAIQKAKIGAYNRRKI